MVGVVVESVRVKFILGIMVGVMITAWVKFGVGIRLIEIGMGLWLRLRLALELGYE